MKIEPNTDIGMSAKNLLVNKGKISFPDGKSMEPGELDSANNFFEELCKSIDPNITYINVIIPDPVDNEVYFTLRDKGRQLGLLVQSVAHRTDEAWSIWESSNTGESHF